MKVLDMLEVPKNTVVLNGCDRNGRRDNALIGFVKSIAFNDKNNQKEWMTNFEQVWQANSKIKKFERVKFNEIRCPNPR